MPRVEIRRDARRRPANPLAEYASSVRSQTGEDGVIRRVFDLIGTGSRYCVDVGAGDGELWSNSWALLVQQGWSGLVVEANPRLFERLRARYAGRPEVAALCRFMDGRGEGSLEAALEQADAPGEIDLLSIDIDGLDWYVWRSLGRFRARVVVIEFNPTVPNDVYFLQDQEPVNHGSSLLAMVELGREMGYELAAVTGANATFVAASRFPALGLERNGPDDIFDPTGWETRIFQLYDGTLVTCGCDRLICKGLPLRSEDLQILPPPFRIFS
ncbi:MAG TPA: hypothetical protein VIG99_27885 [Myxococcaceae bacterium]|jgi:hypothetical protein